MGKSERQFFTPSTLLGHIRDMNVSRFTSCILLPVLICTFIGCATSKPGPLADWQFCYSDNPICSNKAVIDDYQNYIQTLSAKHQGYIGDISFFENRTGQHAVSIEIFEENKNASWQHVLFYDKENKRIRVVRYGYHRYRS